MIIVAGVIGIIGLRAMNTLREGEDKIATINLPTFEGVASMSHGLMRVIAGERGLLAEEFFNIRPNARV